MAALLNVDPSDAEVAARAEAAFRGGLARRAASDQARPHFREAAGLFEELRRRGVDNAALTLDLGNAYLLADDLPHALLAYQHGLRLAPDDAALHEALAAARALVSYPPNSTLGRPVPEEQPPWMPQPRPGWLVVGAALCYSLTWVFLTRWLMTRNSRLLVLGGVFLMGAGGMGLLVARAAARSSWEEAHPLVVIAAEDVFLRKGNGPQFPPRFDVPLSRGVEARLRFERGDWLQIELTGGEVGWVPRQAVFQDSVLP
jgi:tetratricopeptide (TPR) repeat protein